MQKKYIKNIFLSKTPLENKDKIKKMFNTFFDKSNKYPQTFICIISASLSMEFTQSINQSFVNTPHNNMISEIPIQFKGPSWLNRLASNLKNHIIAINFYQTENIAAIDILPCCKALAVEITNILQNKNLFCSYLSTKELKPTHKTTIYTWQGSNFLIFPKKLAKGPMLFQIIG